MSKLIFNISALVFIISSLAIFVSPPAVAVGLLVVAFLSWCTMLGAYLSSR